MPGDVEDRMKGPKDVRSYDGGILTASLEARRLGAPPGRRSGADPRRPQPRTEQEPGQEGRPQVRMVVVEAERRVMAGWETGDGALAGEESGIMVVGTGVGRMAEDTEMVAGAEKIIAQVAGAGGIMVLEEAGTGPAGEEEEAIEVVVGAIAAGEEVC